MDQFIFNQELADFIKEGVKQIVWLEDTEYIDEREFDDVLYCLKEHFEGSKYVEGHEDDFDDWFDNEFWEETLQHYFERLF